MTLNDIRRLAWLAEKQDYRWDLLVSLGRSVLGNVSTVEMEYPGPAIELPLATASSAAVRGLMALKIIK